MRCRFVVHDRDVIAISSYAGKMIRAVAHCDDSDTFDLELGKKLAERKLDLKVAQKKLKRAAKQSDIANIQFMLAMAEAEHARTYLAKAEKDLYEAESELTDLINSLA